jgi:hypothetical protein
VYCDSDEVARFKEESVRGCIDLGRSRDCEVGEPGKPSDTFLKGDEAVAFSFRFSLSPPCTSPLIGRKFGSCFEGQIEGGAEKSEYSLGLDEALDDEEWLPPIDGVCREKLALLLLDRRPLSMNGKRSFIRSDIEVRSSFGREREERTL